MDLKVVRLLHSVEGTGLGTVDVPVGWLLRGDLLVDRDGELARVVHAEGVSWARIGELVGHSDLATTARTYTHVIADEAEVDYGTLATTLAS